MITYIATNTLNGKFYIGSTIDFEKRKKSHINSELEYPFHRALRKNPEAFVWEVYLDDSEGRELEQALLDMWFGKEQCYNLSENASSPSTFRSEEHRKAIGDAHRGKVNSENTRKKISKSKRGKKFDDEYKRKRAEIQREVSNRPELKRQKAEKLRGQKRTPEWKERHHQIMSSPEVKEKFNVRDQNNKFYDPNHPELGVHNAGVLVRLQKRLDYPHAKENRVRVE
jgi:group I intron endonuclease